MLTSNYRLNLNAELFEKYRLTTISTGKAETFSLAVNRRDDSLYSILNKAIGFIRDSTLDASLASYSYVEKRFTLTDFLRLYIVPVFTALEIIFLVIIALLIKSRRAERKAKNSLRALQESLGREAFNS